MQDDFHDYSRFIRRSLKQAQCLYDQSVMQAQADDQDDVMSTEYHKPCDCCHQEYQASSSREPERQYLNARL